LPKETRAVIKSALSSAELHAEYFIKKNLLLIFIAIAFLLALYFPGPGKFFHNLIPGGYLIALIFLVQGAALDLKDLRHLKPFMVRIIWGVFLALILYPLAAYLCVTEVFPLSIDNRVGFILVCSAPCTLAAGTAITDRARGDVLTAILLIVSLNLFGMVTFPCNLKLWLGSAVPVNDMAIVTKLVLYLFLPVAGGQVLKRYTPVFIARTKSGYGYVTVACLFLIIYFSCSAESGLLKEIKLKEVFFLLMPCLSIHLCILATAYITGRYLFKFNGPVNRSITIICSEKPLTLSVAVWSMVFVHTHPLAIFPILLFYVAQIFVDSIWAGLVIRNKVRRIDGTG